MQRAGPFVLTLTHAGASASFEAMCTAGAVQVGARSATVACVAARLSTPAAKNELKRIF